MIEPVLSGIGFGLLLAIMVGPVFFALIQTALHEGFRAGVNLALGVLLSDAAWIFITYFFASQIDLAGKYRVYVGWIGGFIIIAFGVFTLLSKIKAKDVDDGKKVVHAKFMLKGFLLNSFNPAVPVFWLGVISVVKLKEEYTHLHEAFFFGTVLTTVFATDLVKSFASHRLKRLLKHNVLVWISRITGIALVGIGIRMIVKVYT